MYNGLLVRITAVIKNSQHGFTKSKSHLINLIVFYDKMAGFVDEGRALDVI